MFNLHFQVMCPLLITHVERALFTVPVGLMIVLFLANPDVFHHVVTVRNDLTMTCVEFCSTTAGTSTTGTSTTGTSTITTTSPLLYVGTSSGAVYELDTSKQYGDTGRVVNHTQRFVQLGIICELVCTCWCVC